ncbi:MAG: HlyD family type I secretion periplasmic adaptor subunit [Bacillota bacterium]
MLRLLKKKNNIQYEFLPAALEITETPPSPMGSLVIWIIFAIIIVTIIWSCLGRVDEVAVARGKVVPDGRLKVVQPLEEGIVTAIHVAEGQKVKKGQLLVELDSTMKDVDVTSLEKAIETTRLEKELLKKAMEGENLEQIVMGSELPDETKNNLLKLTRSKDEEYQTRKHVLTLIVSQNEEQLQIAKSDVQKIESRLIMIREEEQKLKDLMKFGSVEESNLVRQEKMITILKEEEEKYRELFEAGAVAKNEWLEKYNELSIAEKELETQKIKVQKEKSTMELNIKSVSDEREMTQKELQIQKIRVEQARSKLDEAKTNLETLEKQRNISVLDLVVEKDKQMVELEASLIKAKKSVQFQALIAPVDGRVHGLTSNTIGGVVTPAQPVMTIVPEGTPLIVEAMLLNKDVGFVTEGQEATIKLDTFPFQKYGTLKGEVQGVSPDAFEDEKTGSVYRMKVTLEKALVMVNGKETPVFPGMTVSVEIKTGKRRIIEFFLEPIIKYAEESLKLR